MVSTALEDLLLSHDRAAKRKAAKKDEGSKRKVRTITSGSKALEQHCLKSGDGNESAFLDRMKDYVRDGKAQWGVKARMVASSMWSADTKDKDVLPYNMVPEKHVFVLLEAGIDMQTTQDTGKGIFIYVDVTECRPRCLTQEHLFGKARSRLEPWVVSNKKMLSKL